MVVVDFEMRHAEMTLLIVSVTALHETTGTGACRTRFLPCRTGQLLFRVILDGRWFNGK